MIRRAAAIFVLAMAAGPLLADGFSLSFFQGATDNLFQSRFGVKDAVSTFSLSGDKDFGGLSLFGEAGYSYLADNSGLSDFLLDAGVDFVHSFGAKTAFYASLEAIAAVFRPEFSDFNYAGGRLAASLKSYFGPSSIFKAEAVSEYRRYRYALFDHLSSRISTSIDKYFSTRTTFKAEAAWGYKYFLHPVLVDSAASDDSAGPVPPQSAAPGGSAGILGGPGGPGGVGDRNGEAGKGDGGNVQMSNNGSASGQGPGGGGQGNGNGMSGQPPKGPGQGWHGGMTSLFRTASTSNGQGLQVASVAGLLAQGLGDRLGLRFSGLRQWVLSGQNPFTSVEEYYAVQNPTYDQFSWSGTSWSAQGTVEIPWNVELKMSYTWSRKTFPGIESLGLDGLDLGIARRDKRTQFDARLEKDFAKVSLHLSFSAVKNSSNDPWFEWRGNVLAAGLTWSFAAPGSK